MRLRPADLRLNLHLASARDTLRDRVRATFAPATLWAGTKTILWLLPLTILIWYTAETSRYEERGRSVRIRVTDDAGRNVQLQDPVGGSLTVTFRGQRAALDLLDARVASGQDVELRLQDNPKVGTMARPAEPLLRDSPSLRGITFQVVQTTPPNLGLMIEEFVEKQVPITVPAALQNRVSAQFDPPTVTIRGPAGLINQAEASGTLIAEADIAMLPILGEPGKKEPRLVAILTRLQGVNAVTIKPSTVTATMEVGEADETHTIESMPVFVSAPADFNDEYRVTLEPSSVYNATVIGPTESIRQLRDRKFAPLARVELSADDINRLRGGQPLAKKPSFVLPDKVRVDPTNLEQITINCTAQRRGG